MKIIALALCMLAVSAAAIDADTVMTSLAEMDKDPYMSSIISVISVQTNTGGPIEDIIDMLEDVRDTLSSNQKRENKQYTATLVSCSSDVKSFTKQIKDLTADIKVLTYKLKMNQRYLAQAQGTLIVEEKRLRSLKASLASGIARRAAEHKAFIGHATENKAAISAIHEAINIFSGIHSERKTSLIQITRIQSITDKISAFLQKSSDLQSMYGPIIMSLAQIAVKADSATVKRIMALMEKLRHALRRSLDDMNHDEVVAVKRWAARRHALESNIRTTDNKIRGLKTRISFLKKTISTLQHTLVIKRTDLAQAHKDLRATKKWCAGEKNSYFKVKANRAYLAGKVDKLLAFVQSHLTSIAASVKARVNHK